MRFLINEGNVNADKDKELVKACNRGASGELAGYVLNLLKGGASPKRKTGEKAIFYASRNGYTETVKYLLEYGANVNYNDNKGRSPLLEACAKYQTGVVELLVKNGADVNHLDADSRSVWTYINDTVIAKILLDNGANIELLSKTHNHLTSNRTPLFKYVIDNNIDMVKLLLEYGADMNVVDISGLTVLMWACIKQLPKILELLLNHDTKMIDYINDTKRTALDYSLPNEYCTILLLKHGADISIGHQNLLSFNFWSRYDVQELIVTKQPYNMKLLNDKVGIRDDIREEYPLDYYNAVVVNIYSA